MSVRHGITAAVCALALCTASQAQKDEKLPRWKVDPYTKNDPKKLAMLGYVSFGPFEFGQRGSKIVTTDEIEKHLSYEKILWVETPHFRIGSMLPKWSVPTDPTVKKKLREELGRLQARLGDDKKIKVKPRVLDPWLRLHLFAQRAEEHYALFSDWLGVKDEDFPKLGEKVMIGQGPYMGQGPYLGQEGKYLLLMSESAESMNDYLKTYTGRDTEYGQRWNFKVPGSLIYGIATDMEKGRLKHDTALHANVVFNLTHNFIDGYRHYSYETPVWIREGLAHWFERQISPRWNTFNATEGSPADMKNTWKWEVETRKIIASNKFSPFAETYTWRDYGQINFDDHVACWSRWDYLLSLGKDKFSQFMKGVKGRVDPKTYIADDSNLIEATRIALREAYGLTPLTIDELWAEWVKANYATN
ncbi:MAG: hypothetical protein KDB80_01780 [Planctomycetes bacterium]|nr:hypothetical protein [Planctomycetota bacterium]